MAKTAWIERNKKKAATVKKYAALRAELKARHDYAALEQTAAQRQPQPAGQSLLDVRAASRLFAQVRLFAPDLPRGGPQRLDSGSDESQLVNSMSDPISNMLTSIRNAGRASLPEVVIPHSKVKEYHRPGLETRRLRGRSCRGRQTEEDKLKSNSNTAAANPSSKACAASARRACAVTRARWKCRGCAAVWAFQSCPPRKGS